MEFLTGFLIMTVVGLSGTFLVWSWGNIVAARQRMGSAPQPALRPIRGQEPLAGIGADPQESPLQILNNSCLTIIIHLFLQAVVLIGAGWILLSMPEVTDQQFVPVTVTEGCGVGAVFAGVLGALIRTMVWNWGVIGDLYARMVHPPVPILQFAEPPNIHHVAAAPPMSPQDVVGHGCFEIILRVVLQVFLVGGLGLSLWLAYSYLFAR